jgi:hypothetical protein
MAVKARIKNIADNFDWIKEVILADGVELPTGISYSDEVT